MGATKGKQAEYILVWHDPDGREVEIDVGAQRSRRLDAVARGLGCSVEEAFRRCVDDGIALRQAARRA
jgi:hypothetical protein